MAGESAPLVREARVDLDALGAAVNRGYPLRAPFSGVLTKAALMAAALITGAVTNNRTVSVINRGQDGSGATVMATLNFGAGTNAPAFDEVPVPLSGVAGATAFADGDVLEVRSAAVGTGIADPGGTVVLSLSRV